MPDVKDMDLMREYADRDSEPAFAEIVRRHINLVYSVALRYAGNSQDAQDVTQAVFIILAQKAASLRQRSTLTGWLYETTRFTAMRFLRTKTRRQFREQEAYMQSTLNESDTDSAWRQLAPLLEQAMTRLNEKERTLLALRFFENKSGAEVAALLGIEEWAARKRVERAVEKLRTFFAWRGIRVSVGVLTGAISANSVQAAPVALAKSVTAVALAKGAAASGSTLTLIKGALKIMAWTKAKTAIVTGVVVLLAAGTTTVTVKEIQEHRTYPWQSGGEAGLFDRSLLDQQPPQVRILRSKFTNFAEGSSGDKIMGTGVSAQAVVAAAYGGSAPRTILSTSLPGGRYDYIASLPGGNPEAMQQEAKRKFGVVGKRETREADVLILKVKFPNAPGLKHSTGPNESMLWKEIGSQLECQNLPLLALAEETEALANIQIGRAHV